MFVKIRKRLTLFYTILTTLFLIGFITASYWGLKIVFYHQEEQELLLFAEEEALEHVDILKNFQYSKTKIEEAPEIGGKMFFYVYDKNGMLVSSAKPYKELRSPVNTLISTSQLPIGSIKMQEFYTLKGKALVMITSHGIYNAGRLLGVVYVGTDITANYEVLNRYLLTIALIGLGFLLFIYIFGHIMAGKAIVPIYNSFERQRQFTADASHELRAPLTVLLNSTEAVITDQESSLSPFASQTLMEMKDEIKKISKIVADLLTLARIDAEVQKIFREEFDIVPVIKGVVHSLSSLALKKNIHIELKTPSELIVFADKERLRQLIYILFDNAIKYTGEEGRITLSAYMNEEQIFGFSIKDTGIGIPSEDHKRIFERFYRTDKARSKEESGGTGLGLSIAKWIVDSHDGSITVKSILGQGTTFYVTINSARKKQTQTNRRI